MTSDIRLRCHGIGFVIVLAIFSLAVNPQDNAKCGELAGKVIIHRPAPIETQIVSRYLIRRYVNKNQKKTEQNQNDEHPLIVVYLANFRAPAPNSVGQFMLLDQKNERFVPHVLPIMVGTKVEFINSDDVYHNVFSFSPAKSFDLGRYKRGKSRQVHFDKPGVVKVYCDIHTHMNAFILVLEHPFFTTTDEKGNFRIKDIPPGKYTVKAWHGRWPEKSKEITIGESETFINFEFP